MLSFSFHKTDFTQFGCKITKKFWYVKKKVYFCAMKTKIYLMALLASCLFSCSHPGNKSENGTPITKPVIALESDRLTPEALWAMGRIGCAKVDVETGWIAYTVSYYSVRENRSTSWIRICQEQENGLKILDEFVGTEPAWFGNSGVLAYLKDGQLTLRQGGRDIVLEAEGLRGGEAERRATDVAKGRKAEGFLLSPMRNYVVLIHAVKAHESTQDQYPDLDQASGRVVKDLMYKHWDEWVDEVPHPFIYPMTFEYRNEMEISRGVLGEGVDILEGTAYECPMRPFGGVEQLAWSDDEQELAYTCRKKTGLDYAVSTNSDIYTYNIATHAHVNKTEGMMGYDINPMYSPDGRYLSWLSMEHDGYESDLNRLFIQDRTTGERVWLSKHLDTPIDSYYWEDNEHMVFSAVWHGTVQLYRMRVADGTYTQLTSGQYDHVPVYSIGDKLYYLRHSMREANELYVQEKGDEANGLRPGDEAKQLTFENQNIYDQVEMGQVLPRWQKTTSGEDMLTWIILPPHFDPNRKYPTLLYCEGGPQSPVSQFWSYRWNFMMMAANDYVVVAPNRHGLPGFGSAWNEQISGDYGGQCMRDYLTAIDEACAHLPYVDKNRLGCVGASFGGFSVYWLAGHHHKRFKAFIAHDGIFNMEMQYLETEEKWFANWDMGGAYWDKDNATAQRTFANSPHRFVDQWDTPILCIHGEKDYRILANQGMAAFDAAKMRGIDAELLIFPDENHWVLKPQNGILWQRTFFDFLNKHL